MDSQSFFDYGIRQIKWQGIGGDLVGLAASCQLRGGFQIGLDIARQPRVRKVQTNGEQEGSKKKENRL
jgi:hypothetical protein